MKRSKFFCSGAGRTKPHIFLNHRKRWDWYFERPSAAINIRMSAAAVNFCTGKNNAR